MDNYGLGAAKYQLQLKYSASTSAKAQSRTIGAINAPASGADSAFITKLRAFFVRGYSVSPGNVEFTNFVESRPIVLV